MQIDPIVLAAVSVAAIVVPQTASRPAEWSLEKVPLAEAVTEVRQTADSVYVRAGNWYVLSLCADGIWICPELGEPVPPEVPDDGIPGGLVATGDGESEGIQRAWYAGATDRYAHGALGDAIEASVLVAEDVFGTRYQLELDPSDVFEDLTPRIVDIDDDGRNEIITIHTSLRSGASVAVYGLSGSRLIQRAATPPIGRPNRWLNIAGIADFTGDGQLNIAVVKTPHIGGRLEILAWDRNTLKVLSSAEGFSNHAFGSTEMGLSAIASVDGDRIPDLILPDAERKSLRMVTAAGGWIRDIANVPLPSEAVTAIGTLTGSGRPAFVVGLGDGSLVAVAAR
jgi:hypothetical protein